MHPYKKFLCVLAAILLLGGCGAPASEETGVETWLDYYFSDDMPWGKSRELALPDFPGVTFTWTPYVLTARDGAEEQELFQGMPIWNVFLSDLTGDGLPEFCATVSIGSGIIDNRVVVYDYAAGALYELSARFDYDYTLEYLDGALQVTKSEAMGPAISVGTLAFVPEDGGRLEIAQERPASP